MYSIGQEDVFLNVLLHKITFDYQLFFLKTNGYQCKLHFDEEVDVRSTKLCFDMILLVESNGIISYIKGIMNTM